MTDEKTVIAKSPRQPAVMPAQSAPPPPDSAPRRQPLLPIVLLGAVAVLLLVAGAGIVVMQVQNGGGPTEVSEEDLQNDLVMVEEAAPAPPPEIEAEEPEIIALSGNPVVLQQHVEAPIQPMLIKLDAPAALKGAAIGVKGEIYRLTDALTVADTGLTAGLTGSQQSYAFFQSSDEEPDPGDSGVATNATTAATQPDDSVPSLESGDADAETQNTSIITVNDNPEAGAWTTKQLLYRVPAQKQPAAALVEWGFSEQSAKLAEAALAQLYNLRTFNKDDEIALKGFQESGVLTLAQLSVKRVDQPVRILALTDQSTYAQGEDPWFGHDMFEETLDTLVQPEAPRLLDAIYGVAVRNNVPTAVIGETILLLSRSNDLDQPVIDGQRITLLYNSAARDRKTGFGKVLYVHIDRAQTNIECFAYQSKPGTQFDCISGDGQGIVSNGGMVTPVKGVISAKFGPNNSGVDWAAAAGTPVLAAFSGQITAIKTGKQMGTVVEIKHENNRRTSYAHLQRIANGLAEGIQVRAGQVIGFVGKTGQVSEPSLHFELYENDYAIDPFGEYQRVVERGGALDQMVNQIIHIESAGKACAKNPLSTAVGLGQFIKSTWMTTVRMHRPSLLVGRSTEEVLALRCDPVIARDMLTEFTRDNERYIRAQGVTSTPGNLYLAHFLGVGGAVIAAKAPAEAMLVDLFGQGVINANGFLRGRTAGYVREWAARKMSGKYRPLTVTTGTGKPLISQVADAAFAKFKQTVTTMIQ